MRYCPTCETKYDDAVEVCPEDGARLFVVPESQSAQHIGKTLDGRWLLESVIGEGAMGAVYKAVQKRTNQVAAVKIIQARSYDETELVSRFFREAQVLSSLQHPHIVKLLDFGQDGDSQLFFIAMELLRGVPLSKATDLSLVEILALMEQLADALAQTHAQGIIHRDLKPENLFVDRLRGGGVHMTVLDYGIAKVDEGQIAKLTATGTIQGTPHYMAPEQIQGKGVGPMTDIYAMGCILYEILAGRAPFEGEAVMAVLMAHLQSTPDPLAKVWKRREAVHAPLVDLCNRMMSRDPAGRPPDALALHRELKEMRQALEATIISGQGLVALATPTGPIAPPVAPPPAPPAPKATQPITRTTLGMVVAGFLTGLVVVGGVGWYVAADHGARGPVGADAEVAQPKTAAAPVKEEPAVPVVPVPDASAPAEVVAEPDAGGVEAKVAIDAPQPDVGVAAVPDSVAPTARKARKNKRRRDGKATKGRKKKGGLGDVLKGMRKP